MSTQPIHPILVGEPDEEEITGTIKPVRYRYVMAYLHDEVETVTNAGGGTSTITHKAGEVLHILPMTATSYRNGVYSGTEFAGSIYIPDFYLDLMVHQPSYDFERIRHPDQQGRPIGAMFECGNRAIYVLRNEEVVWGGILWTRSYSSGSPTLSITALSWDGYLYYRLLRRSIVFKSTPKKNTYTIWYAMLRQALSDYTWTGTDNGLGSFDSQSIDTGVEGADPVISFVSWTGLTKNGTSNAAAVEFEEVWRNNSPHIELPPADLKLYVDPNAATKVEVTEDKEFHGYDMNMVGQQLEEWADTKTMLSDTTPGNGQRFEYRVVCWFDASQQLFRQRYVFGDMSYAVGQGPTTDNPAPTGILSPSLGKNTQAMAKGPDNTLIFDFPGHISSWSLTETNEGCATRVIATDSGDQAVKHVEYASQTDLLNVPAGDGKQGWLLYDHVESYDLTEETQLLTKLKERAAAALKLLHVGQASQINDMTGANGTAQRSSERSTSLQVTLYTTPDRPFPKFEIGDWATFAIEDPFYGGKMYLVRRIMGYTVTVVPEQENDYSHETIELDLTDDTQIAMS
jgi:hypothetical protein